KVTSGTSETTVSAAVVRTKVRRGRRAVRARIAARPTPIIEKMKVNWVKPRSGISWPASSASETPAAEATAASAVVARDAAAAAATPCFQTAGRVVATAVWTAVG